MGIVALLRKVKNSALIIRTSFGVMSFLILLDIPTPGSWSSDHLPPPLPPSPHPGHSHLRTMLWLGSLTLHRIYDLTHYTQPAEMLERFLAKEMKLEGQLKKHGGCFTSFSVIFHLKFKLSNKVIKLESHRGRRTSHLDCCDFFIVIQKKSKFGRSEGQDWDLLNHPGCG